MDKMNENITVRLGSTGIIVNKNGFGALPIQRVSDDQAVYLLKKAYQGGSAFLTQQGLIVIVSISLVWHLRESGSRCL